MTLKLTSCLVQGFFEGFPRADRNSFKIRSDSAGFLSMLSVSPRFSGLLPGSWQGIFGIFTGSFLLTFSFGIGRTQSGHLGRDT